MVQAGINRFLGVDPRKRRIDQIQLHTADGIPALAIPAPDELAQGFDAIYQFTGQGMEPRIKEALDISNALNLRMHFQLTDSADERVFAAIIEEEIELDTSGIIEGLTSNRSRIPGLTAVSEGLGVVLSFRGISLTKLGAQPKARLTWDVEAVVQALQTITGDTSTVPVLTDGGDPTSLMGGEGPGVTTASSIHRFLATLAIGRLELAVDISTETDVSAVRAVAQLQSQLDYALKEGSGKMNFLSGQSALVQQLVDQMRNLRETVWIALRDTTDMDNIIDDLISVLAGQTIALTPSCAPGGTTGIDLSVFSGFITQAVSTPGNRLNAPVLSLCIKTGSTDSEELLEVKPFCGSSNCAYLVKPNVLRPVFSSLWSSSQSPSKNETIHDISAEFEYEDGSTGTGSVDLVMDIRQFQPGSLKFDADYLSVDVTIGMKVVKAIDPEGNDVRPPYPESTKLTEWHLYPFKTYADLKFQDPGEGVAADWHTWLTDPLAHPFRTAQTLSEGSSEFHSSAGVVVMRCDVL